MTYNRFEVRLSHNAADIALPDSTEEFAEFRWVKGRDIPDLQQPPGTSDFWYENGYIPIELS